jgi:hypothetical protein
MTPEGLLREAQFLAQSSAVEGVQAVEELFYTAINRAYHAAFTAARRHQRDVEEYTLSRNEPSHKQVRDKFNEQDPLLRQRFVLLSRLKELRCRADYDDEQPPSSSDMKLALHFSAQALSKIQHLSARKA